MIGPKKLDKIENELRQTLGKNRKRLEACLDQRASDSARLREDLLWVRNLLEETAADKRKSVKKPAKAKTRRTTSRG